jgi:hypothetical protein
MLYKMCHVLCPGRQATVSCSLEKDNRFLGLENPSIQDVTPNRGAPNTFAYLFSKASKGLDLIAIFSWSSGEGVCCRSLGPGKVTHNQCYFFGRQGVRGRQKINCLGLWRSKTFFFGGGWRPESRQVINSLGELWHSRTPTNEFGCHCLAGGILRISSSSDVRKVYRHIQHRAAPRPPGSKGGSVVMNKRDTRTGTGLRLNTT